MNKFSIAALLSAFVAAPALAVDMSKLSVGAGYGFGNNGVLSLRGDYDIADLANDQPVKMRVGYDRYTVDSEILGNAYSWAINVFYAGAYYDFNEKFNLDSRLHPFAGLGLGFGSATCSGVLCGSDSIPSVGGFYYIGGVQYDITDEFSAEAGFSAWGGLSIGANYNF